jgi:ubiquitin conjugation factor E4 B
LGDLIAKQNVTVCFLYKATTLHFKLHPYHSEYPTTISWIPISNVPLPRRLQIRRKWTRFKPNIQVSRFGLANICKIRRRRLEKLSGSSTPAPRSEQQQIDNEGPSSAAAAAPAATVPEAAEEATAPASSRPTINVTKANPADTNSSTPADNPFSKLTARPSPSVSNIQPTSGNLKRLRAESDEQTPQPAALPAALPAPKKHAAPLFDEPIDVYENRILQHIFRITLDPNQKVDASNHKLIFLPKLRQELVDDSEPIMLTKERLDSALLEAGSTIPNSKPILDYLLPSWKRITKALKGLRGYANAKDAILKEAKRLCMSYCIFALEMPDLYG